MIDLGRDAVATGRIHQIGGFLDRLRPVHFGWRLSRRAPGHVDRRSGRAQLYGNAAAGAAGGACDQRDLARKRALQSSGSHGRHRSLNVTFSSHLRK